MGNKNKSTSKKKSSNPLIEKEETAFPVVGIGASAGGLEAFEKFFLAMPSDTGMAFILVTHLSPDYKSMLPNLLKKFTSMEVFEIEDGMKIAPNSVYVIPPKFDLTIFKNELHLLNLKLERKLHHPIDYFFRSLARDLSEKAIGIILSGTGTDGVAGLKVIKGAGGMIMVQDPQSIKFNQMAQSAIDTGLVDYVLLPEEMPSHLIQYVKYYRRIKSIPTEVHLEQSRSLQKILILLRDEIRHDFSGYKLNTIIRRIERRMSVHQISEMEEYAKFLQENLTEIDMLFRELTIGVTSFFRNPEAFTILKQEVCPHIFENKSKQDAIRIWVPGCSMGEEAFSIAIILREYMVENNLYNPVQIFATDIDEEAILSARASIYPISIASEVSFERLNRFFIKEGNCFRVNKEIREMVVFANQSIIKDPPFSKLDLISCRNLLIYFGKELQNKVFSIFFYSLIPSGILFLGSSETIGEFTDRFDSFTKKWKFFKKKLSFSLKPSSEMSPGAHFSEITFNSSSSNLNKKKRLPNQLESFVFKFLVDEFAPICVLIERAGEILYIHGRTGAYLEPASGQAKMNLYSMAREGLATQLPSAVQQCLIQKKEICLENLLIKTNGDFQSTRVKIKRFPPGYNEEPLFLVSFEEEFQTISKKEVKLSKSKEKKGVEELYIERLEEELRLTRESLQVSIEELEVTNEELKSTNEELQSTNEELQSTNEELETSKEELQSLNEELVGVNYELQKKIDELTETNNDMTNLLDSTQIATIFLNTNLTIKRFTPETTEVVNLIDTDIGRPISHLASNLRYKKLNEDIQKVLKSLIPIERDIQTKEGHWYTMKIRPYRTSSNRIDGVVLTFSDINRLKEMEAKLRKK